MEDKKNEELVKKISTEWAIPKFPYWTLSNPYPKFLNSLKYDIPFDIKDWTILVSGLFLLIDAILESIALRMQNFNVNFDIDILVRILLGTMIHEYYTTGQYGEKMWDILEKEHEARENRIEYSFKTASQWTNLIAFHMEEIWWATVSDYNSYIKRYKKAIKWENSPLTEIEFNAMSSMSISKIHLYKFNKEWLQFLKYVFRNEPDIVKWFRQTRIKRIFNSNVKPILTSIVSAIYYPEELFMVIDPYFFDVQICDRKNLKCHTDHIHFVVSFTNILHSFFCEHCIKKNFSEYELDFSKEITEEETVKKMFDEVYWMLSGVCPDELSINIKWKVKDNNKYEKIKEKITHGNVGFDRYDWKNKWVTFNVKKDLKWYKKKVK